MDQTNANHILHLIANYPGTVIDIEHHLPSHMDAFYHQKIQL
ncbi:hypothetical protein [Streptococcus cuniculi]|nr:hypothetical protein [Streptococcus cuniculi]